MDTPENRPITNSDSESARGALGADGTFGSTVRETTTTEWDTVTRRYRRGLGGPWWLALIGVPAILAAVGLGINGDDNDTDGAAGGSTSSQTTDGSGGASSASPSDASSANASATPFSLQRVGNDLTVKGVVPDDAAKTALLDDIKAKVPGVNIVDQVTVTAGAAAAPTAALGALADAAAAGGDFSFDFDGNALVLKGVAATEEAKAAAEAAAKSAFPDATIDNQLTVGSGAATPTPSASPSASASGGADAAGTAGCATLGADIKAITDASKLTFANNGTTLAASSQATVKAVAEKWKGCTTAKLVVTGYTSSPGSTATNLRISAARAAAVKKALEANGVTAANVASAGKGEANPIASNATTAGQNANRRVEITVG
ncbi:OmpA family protein [Knoellia subterranea]|uniref:OmpA-like domain-containing protein n=1 Tax=Knoellia subterranea KCTC 19937 TaxID=1385521 RepID=A0A0A0JHI6_9MICO|nr:OmpA family protein [Knoellia subterranea]KGN36219.1 hypothetical protein N803_04985 [Knoellia subterranea KCTC 19937]